MTAKNKHLKKMERKLELQRSIVVDWLKEIDRNIQYDTADNLVLQAAYLRLGWNWKGLKPTLHGVSGAYGSVIGRVGLKEKLLSAKTVKAKVKPPKSKPANFYKSYEWRKLRYQVIKRDGGRCLMCGSAPEDGAVLNVDHIKPLRANWSLRLDPTNLQTLCGICNHGKGNWDETDWRVSKGERG